MSSTRLLHQLLLLTVLISAVSGQYDTNYLLWESQHLTEGRRKICDIRVMSSEKLCLMQHASDGPPHLTIEPLLRKRIEPVTLSLKGLDTGLLPDIADSYVRSVGTPFSRKDFKVVWAADVLLCTDDSCNAVLDVRWIDQEKEALGLILYILPDGRLGFGLNYNNTPIFNPKHFSAHPMKKLSNFSTARVDKSTRSTTGGRRRIVYNDIKQYRPSRSDQFDLYSLRNTAMLERVERDATPLVGRVKLLESCHLLVYPISQWYKDYVRMGPDDRCENVSDITFLYGPTESGRAVHCDVRSQKTINARASCYNSSWITTGNDVTNYNLLIPRTLVVGGIEFNSFTTLGTQENDISQSHEWSMFSIALRGVIAEGQSQLPSACYETHPSVFPSHIDHNLTLPINCRDLESQVSLRSTVRVQEEGKTIQDFVTPVFAETSDTSNGVLSFANFERLDRRSVASAIEELQQDMLRRAREIEDQFSTRLSETYTSFGAAMAFLVALFGVLLAWPSLRDTVRQYWLGSKVRVPIVILYLFFTLTVVMGLILPIIVDEAVARQNRQDRELQTLQNSAPLGGYGNYSMVMITSVALEPVRDQKVWIFYSFILALCVALIVLGLVEARRSSRTEKVKKLEKNELALEEDDDHMQLT